ncbi:MAG: histidine phosphatase family protein [Candidatus Obscuribacterales bacterium]|nr:histidine phosphatase family protein [Steroidobacteraceae bacterium]
MPVVLMALAVVVGVWLLDARGNTVVVVVRDAEVETGDSPDPNLSLAGRERAARLARVWGQSTSSTKLDAIFAIDTRRAQQTIAPLAEAIAVPINVVPSANWSELADRIRRDHRGQVVLVAGQPQQAAALVAALAKEDVVIAESDYDAMFVMFLPRIARNRLLSWRY